MNNAGMKKTLLVVAAGLVLLLGVLRAAGDQAYWGRWLAGQRGGAPAADTAQWSPRVKLPGADGAVPRATAEAELIAPEALEAVGAAARERQVRALVVHRHGHRVFEHFAAGEDGAAQVAGGELAGALLALSLGPLVDTRRVEPEAALQAIRDAATPDASVRNPWSAAARRRFGLSAPPALLAADADGSLADTVAQRVWQPLGAADAWLWGEGDGALRVDCCAVARLDDWMRLGDLLLLQGSYQGTRIVSPDWVRHLLATDRDGRAHPAWLGAQQPWEGDEPPVGRDVYWFDLGSDLRLWLAPRRALAVLVWSGAGSRDTLLPNIVLRGLLDQAAAPGGQVPLGDMVPGH